MIHSPGHCHEKSFFIFSREDCRNFKSYPLYYKKCDILFRKPASRGVCAENQILFVDIFPLLMKHNPDAICYLFYPFVGDFRYPNESRVIPNVPTDIIPFIFSLYSFASIEDYMVHAVRPCQRHYVVEERLQSSHRKSVHP